MNPVTNPFAPGAGSPPPELAGRDELRETVCIAIERTRAGKSARSVLMVGLRGVGKTVLLDRMRVDAEAAGILTVRIEAPEERSLPALLAPQLRIALLRLSKVEQAKDVAVRALRALAGFAKGLKLTYGDIDVGLDYECEPGLADNGDLEHDLQALLETVGTAAKAAKTALVMFVDELQYVPEPQLSALITAMHRCAQRQMPVLLVGAGLPQLRGRMGNAKSYAERLFEFPQVGALTAQAASLAIIKPIEAEGAVITASAVEKILADTRCYPYFLQEWGQRSWEAATDGAPIGFEDAALASKMAVAALDESFFRVRFDRLTPHEKRYLRAMAELGAGPHRSGAIAEGLNREVSSLGPVRSSLIAKGMIWSPGHGDTAFTVPLFDEFMQRTMPGNDWR
jgi:hypothetical protein